MFQNISSLLSDSVKLHNQFIDLEIQGLKSFNRIFNDLTYNFYKPLTSKMEEQVVDFGSVMKNFADKMKV